MLIFRGISFENEKLQRYLIEYKLRQSYIYTYDILKKHKLNNDKALISLKKTVDNIYQDQKELSLTKENNFNVAIKMRSRDIILFFQKYQSFANVLWKSLEILILAVSIQKKWEHLLNIFVKKEFSDNFLEHKKNRDFLEDYLLFVWLCFLDQTSEKPPLNLRLYFVSGEFPKCNWSVTDYSEKTKVKEWQPNEDFCQLNFLRFQLYEVFLKKENIIEVGSQTKEQITEDKPKQIKLAYDFKDQSSQMQQESLFESSPEEILNLFIQEILNEYRNQKGSNHFIAILYQIQKKYKNGRCNFSWQDHFQLISNYQSSTNFKNQITIAKKVFEKLQNLKVIRIYQTSNTFEIQNSLITFLHSVYYPQQKFLKKNLQHNQIELQVDSIIIPNKNHLINFSSSLCFLPLELLKENQKIYPFLVLLVVYLYDCWFCEYLHLQGRIERKIKDLIDGSFVKVTDSKKYRVAQRMRSALQYLKKKNYIGNYQLCSSSKNILDISYLLSAPLEFHQKMKDFTQNEDMQKYLL